MASSHILSKSTFIYGCQCPKRLYYHKRRPDLRHEGDEQQQTIFTQGTSVGQLARKLFPGGRDASPTDLYSYHVSVDYTQELIDRGDSIIYEAAFQFNGVLCALDILIKKGNVWYAFEVKSSTSVKTQYIQDAALQYFVVTNSGLELADMSIVFLNNQYVRQGALDIPKLFTAQSILEDVLEQQINIALKIKELKNIISEPSEPVIDIGPHCVAPYPCDFIDHCWQHIPKENSIFELSRGPVWKLYEAGYRHLDDIPADFTLSSKVAMQLQHYHSGETYIDVEALGHFLTPLAYPLYFFDFETIMPGIPEFDGSRPYQQIPFQHSLHIKRTPEAELEHKEFLGDGVTDPRKDLMRNMLNDLGNSGSIVCYNMTFEKSRIKELSKVYPQYEKELSAINDRVIDLMIPFSKRWFYHPAFKGSYSIKAVLPVLIPELKYTDLVIQEGSMAGIVYSQLKGMDAATAEEQMRYLLDYCKLDTLAMVRILEYLKELV